MLVRNNILQGGRKIALCILGCVLVCIGLSGCNNVCTNIPDAIVGNRITGKIVLEDEHCKRTSSNAGITISVVGTSIYTISDSSGMWEMRGLPRDSCFLRYSKNGYVPFEVFIRYHPEDSSFDWSSNVMDEVCSYQLFIDSVTNIRFIGTTVLFDESAHAIDLKTGAPPVEGFNQIYFLGRTPFITADSGRIADPSVIDFGSTAVFDVAAARVKSGDTLFAIGYPLGECYRYSYRRHEGDSSRVEFIGGGRPSSVIPIVVP